MAKTWQQTLQDAGITGGDESYYMRGESVIDPDEVAALRQQWQQQVQTESGLPWFEDSTVPGYTPSTSAQAFLSLSQEQQQQVSPLLIQFGGPAGGWGATDAIIDAVRAGQDPTQVANAWRNQID